MACGQKSGKILVENLREYFRGVFVVFALLSQSDCLSFWIAKRRGRGEKGENWLAARVGVGLAARALVLCHTEITERFACGEGEDLFVGFCGLLYCYANRSVGESMEKHVLIMIGNTCNNLVVFFFFVYYSLKTFILLSKFS